jgi:uncharacterized protein (DUF697 family)
MAFWNIVKEVTTKAIREESQRSFLVGIAGAPEAVAAVREAMLGPNATPEQRDVARSFLLEAPTPFTPEVRTELARCSIVLLADDEVAPADLRPVETLAVTEADTVIDRLLDRRPEWGLSLARHLPGFRDEVCRRVIFQVSRVNAEVAVVSSLPHSLPILAPLFPAVASTDILILTKNQIMMLMRLAAAHGLEPVLMARMKELMPVVGGAFGWRAVARELVGLVPGGAGVLIKGTIAFAGTYATGHAARTYYQLRRAPTPAEMRRLYEEAAAAAKGVVTEAIQRLRRGK